MSESLRMKTEITSRQRRRLDQERFLPERDPEWAIIDLNLLAEAQETVGRLTTYMRQQLGGDHPFTGRMARLRRDLKAMRDNAALCPEEDEGAGG
jgi:hypothetical protein